MSTYSPSYLHKNRCGIFHFRCRIPISIRKKHNLKKVEIRKSLGTGNRTEALRLSRIMWVKLEQSDYIMHDLEAEIEEFNKLLDEGLQLYKELQSVESNPDNTPSKTAEFMDWLAPKQKEALARYQHYREAREKKQQKDPHKENGQPKQEPPQENGINNISKKELLEVVQQANKKELTTIRLQEAFERYISYADRLHNWTDKDKHIVDINIFIDIVAIDMCCDLSIEDIIKYRDTLVNLPYRYDIDKDCKGLSYVEMAKLPNKKHASPNTLVNKVGVVKNFLRWCEDSNYIDVGFEKPFKTIKKSKKTKSNRVPYTPDELTRLFNSKQYIQGTHKNAARYWVLLIALFTGARLNEICQLHKSNVAEDSLCGIWYFDFNDYSKDRGKKTNAMIRFVPIHPQLKKLGFFKYLNSVNDDSRLFSMLKKKDRSYGTSITKFYGTYKNKNNCNIEIPEGIMKDFHSFRNTIINSMKQRGIPESSAREVVGHENPSLTYGGYADPLDLPNRKKLINKVNYPSIDWSLVKEKGWR